MHPNFHKLITAQITVRIQFLLIPNYYQTEQQHYVYGIGSISIPSIRFINDYQYH